MPTARNEQPPAGQPDLKFHRFLATRGLQPDLIAQAASAINFLRTAGGAAGVSLCAIVLEWRLGVHGEVLAHPSTNPARLAAFNESFLMLAIICALAIVAAWQMRDKST